MDSAVKDTWEALFNKEMVTQLLLWTSSSRARQGSLPQSHGCDLQISPASVTAIPFYVGAGFLVLQVAAAVGRCKDGELIYVCVTVA